MPHFVVHFHLHSRSQSIFVLILYTHTPWPSTTFLILLPRCTFVAFPVSPPIFRSCPQLRSLSFLSRSPFLSRVCVHASADPGFDRLMSILCKTQSIRDVIAFPKTSGGTDLMFKSPAPVDAQTLKQYGIQSVVEGLSKDNKAKTSS